MGNIKVLIATANFGDIDQIHEPCEQVGGFDVCFMSYDEDLSEEKEFTNRELYKMAKTHFYRDAGYDMYIWIDGRVQITSPEFCEYIYDMCCAFDIGAVVHPERLTLADEYDYMLKNINNPYLSVRYKNEDWASEIDAFKDRLDAKLYNARLFVLMGNSATEEANYIEFMQEWWQLIQQYTIFDQTQYTYLLDKYSKNLNIKQLYWDDLNQYTVTHKHIKNI